ncbi:MAG: DUF799 domain-containing protein, partial [Neisseriaceae bacterium]|nr:DUF799 domain-containing protein [Neisseriaceae bacterium]
GSGVAVDDDTIRAEGLIGALVSAAVNQIVNATTDKSHVIAGRASNAMLHGVRNAGITGPYLVEAEQTKP